jgi:TPR repeat protein
MAAEYYGIAAERGHSEAKLNRARCMRLLGQWEPPDRSSESVSHPPSPDRLSEIFRSFLQNPEPLDDDGRRLLSSLQRMKTAASVPHEIQSGRSSVVQIELDSESNPTAVKRGRRGIDS